MSDVAKKELRIVGFLCNWCSYGGADTAGVGRFKQPTDLRIIRVPCSGRVDPLFVAKAFANGADGVLVSGLPSPGLPLLGRQLLRAQEARDAQALPPLHRHRREAGSTIPGSRHPKGRGGRRR